MEVILRDFSICQSLLYSLRHLLIKLVHYSIMIKRLTHTTKAILFRAIQNDLPKDIF